MALRENMIFIRHPAYSDAADGAELKLCQQFPDLGYIWNHPWHFVWFFDCLFMFVFESISGEVPHVGTSACGAKSDGRSLWRSLERTPRKASYAQRQASGFPHRSYDTFGDK